MSGSPTQATPVSGPAAGGDPSMEDILASIRRILSEEEPAAEEAKPAPAAKVEEPPKEDILLLDPSMLVPEDDEVKAAQPAEEEIEFTPPPLATAAPIVPPADPLPTFETLISPEPAAAAASSVDTLVRTLATDRSMLVTSHGPTIEDIVRQEIRPLLTAWLDVNLPPLVERLVRTEIERVVGRVAT